MHDSRMIAQALVRVPLAGASGTTTLLAKAAGKVQRLHYLYVTINSAATVEIEDKDGNVLATWDVAANQVLQPFAMPVMELACCLQGSTVNLGLQIVASAGDVDGFAIVSSV